MFLKTLLRTAAVVSSSVNTRRHLSVIRHFKSFKPIKRVFSSTPQTPATPIISLKNAANTVEIAKTPPKMLLAFTCKPCGKRSSHTISKQAYTTGVVLVLCPQCSNRHLIADNLQWFDQKGSPSLRNIEDIIKEKGESIKRTSDDPEDCKFITEFLSNQQQQ